ncbi:ribonuclease H-like domain-containing protein [Tanacetum coccineum]
MRMIRSGVVKGGADDQENPDNNQNPPIQTPQAPHSVSTVKLPTLKKGDNYDIWAMKMEHYITHTDYPLWQIILNGNSPKKISTDTNGIIRVLPPKSAEDFLAIERERKARTTLLMALPEDHLYGFHNISDAKEMWDAIKSRFGGNAESKKMQKYILKQEFESFSVSNSEGLHKGYDRFQKLLSQLEVHGAGYLLSFDDLYNNLRVFESDVKGSGGSSSSAHNVAFVGSECTTSTNEVSTAYGSSTSSGQHTHKESSSSYVDEVMHSFFANQSNPTEVSYEDLTQVDKHDLEEMDLKWQMAMLSMRVNKFYKKTGRRLKFNEKEPAGFDKSKVECFKCHKMGHFARECRSKGTQDSKRRDAGYNAYKAKEGGKKQAETKALAAVDGESIDWNDHAEDDADDHGESIDLNSRVKSLEVALKRKSRKVILSESEGQEPENQGRKIQDIDVDPLISLAKASMNESATNFITPSKVSASGEAQQKDISPTTMEAARTLSQVASERVSTYKRRRRSSDTGLDVNTDLDFFNTAKERIKTIELNTGSSPVKSGGAEISTDKGQREGKAQMTEEDIQATEKKKCFHQGWTMVQLKNLSFKELKQEFKKLTRSIEQGWSYKKMKKSINETEPVSVKEEEIANPVKKTGKRRKTVARKRRSSQATAKGDDEDSKYEKEKEQLSLYLTIASDEDKEVDYEILDQKSSIIEWKSEYYGVKPMPDEVEVPEEINVINCRQQKRNGGKKKNTLGRFDNNVPSDRTISKIGTINPTELVNIVSWKNAQDFIWCTHSARTVSDMSFASLRRSIL